MKQIGVLIPAIVDPLQTELIESIYETAASCGYDVIVLTNTTNAYDDFPHNDYTTGEENIFSLIETVKLDGIIFVSQAFKKTILKQQIAEQIRKTGIPCVDTGGTSYGFETVNIPQKRAFYDMTVHLIEHHSCRKLLCLAGFEGNPDSEERIAGFLEAATEFHAESDIVYGDFWKESPIRLGHEILSGKREKPDAVVCANDVMAANLCDTLEAGGLSVPSDIIITGYDGHLSALAHFPTITTIDGQHSMLGKIATKRLLSRLGETVSHSEDTLDLILNASCGCAERTTDSCNRSFLLQAHCVCLTARN